MRSPGSVLGYLRDEGVLELARRAVRLTVERVHKDVEVVVLVRAIGEPGPDDVAAPDGAQILDVDVATEHASELYMSADGIARRIGRGDLLVGVRGSELEAFAWLTAAAEWLTSVERLLTPAANQAYVYNVRTRPAFRGRGHFARVMRCARDELARRGVRELITVVEAENRSSLRAFAKDGFEEVGRERLLRRWGRTRRPEVESRPGEGRPR